MIPFFSFTSPNRSRLWSPWLIILITVAVFTWLQNTPTFADPDSFYHAKITVMNRDYGLLTDFPWTQNSLYKELFIDHHFLYHVLLTPFVSFTDPLIGLKIATIIFASLSVLAIIWLLYKERVPWLWLWLLLLLTSSPFIFRLSLGKAPSLAIGVTFIAWYLILKKRPAALFLWSWFFVWFYSAWPVLIIMLAVNTLVNAIYDAYQKIKDTGSSLGDFVLLIIKVKWARPNRLLWLAVLGGIGAGIIINPYFPTNLIYLKQLFSMSVVGYYKFVGIGNEWYPWPATELIEKIAVPLLVWIITTITFFINLKKQSKLAWSAWLMTIIFFLYTVKARRQAEYLVPWLVISSAIIIRDSLIGTSLKSWRREFSSWLPWYLRGKLFSGFMLVYLIIFLPLGFGKGLIAAHRYLANGFSLTHLAQTSQWLNHNSRPGEIVFQSDWGTFPLLFYNNIHNYYLTGLDQTFMYEYNRQQYQLWVDATTGERPDLYNIAKNDFAASRLLLEKRNTAMLPWINRDKRFMKVYQDDEATIFKL